MHWIQSKLLELSKAHDIGNIKRAELVRLVGCRYQSQIDHHLAKLIADGKLVEKNGQIKALLDNTKSLFRIPIMGEADCGEATKFADGRVYDYLTLSPSVTKIKHPSSTYALIARGESMTKADIDDGDYILIERKDTYDDLDGSIVVSNVGGLANVKRFTFDRVNNRIVLLSESYRQNAYAPIIISPDDDYAILGKVIDVVKAVKV